MFYFLLKLIILQLYQVQILNNKNKNKTLQSFIVHFKKVMQTVMQLTRSFFFFFHLNVFDP